MKDSQEFWLTAEQQLDDACKPYGKGKNATGARNIRPEDINKVTGYNPETAGYGKGQIYEYGNKTTWYYTGTNTLRYTTSNGLSGTREFENGFHYYDGEKFVEADLTKTTGIITTIENNGYRYRTEKFDKSKAFTMLFGLKEASYSLATVYQDFSSFGILGVYEDLVGVILGFGRYCGY